MREKNGKNSLKKEEGDYQFTEAAFRMFTIIMLTDFQDATNANG